MRKGCFSVVDVPSVLTNPTTDIFVLKDEDYCSVRMLLLSVTIYLFFSGKVYGDSSLIELFFPN